MSTAISRTKNRTGKPTPGGRRSARPDRAAWGFVLPFVALFLFTFVVPLGYAVYQSLLKPVRSGSLGLGPATVGFAGLDNYSSPFSSRPSWRASRGCCSSASCRSR